MKMKRMLWLLLLLGLIFNYGFSSKVNSVKHTNDKIRQIDKKIIRNGYSSFIINHVMNDIEVYSIRIQFFYIFNYEKDSFRLVCAKFEMPKEIYSIEYCYYYNEKECLIKFTKKIINRPDNSPKQAIIYDNDGKIVWSNFPYKLPIDTNKLNSIFKGFSDKLLKLIDGHWTVPCKNEESDNTAE